MLKNRSKMFIEASCSKQPDTSPPYTHKRVILVHTGIVLSIASHGRDPVLKSTGSSLEASDVWTFVLIKNFSKPFLSKSQARRNHNQD